MRGFIRRSKFITYSKVLKYFSVFMGAILLLASLPLLDSLKIKDNQSIITSVINSTEIIAQTQKNLDFFEQPDIIIEEADKSAVSSIKSSSRVELNLKRVPISGNVQQLKYFFNALKSARNKKIRIGHYGDSIVLGDVFTEYLRYNFQKRFGGDGIGFLSLVSSTNKMRRSIDQTFSEDWDWTSLFLRNPKKLPLGIAGTIAIPKRSSWLKCKTTNFIKSSEVLSEVDLYYKGAKPNAAVSYKFNNGSSKKASLNSGNKIQKTSLKAPRGSKSVEIRFNGAENTQFYGMSIEKGNGVYVDNLPIRGNTGVSLIDIPLTNLKEFSKYLDYKLIILNFGVNLSAPQGGNYNYYIRKMVSVIKHFKKAFPRASYLVVSVADKVVRSGGKFKTDRYIKGIINAQKEIASKTNVAFWNLFEAMGGEEAMVDFVNHAPPLAVKDYRHFTHEGGKIIGKQLYDALMARYK